MQAPIDLVPEARRAILMHLKSNRWATIPQLAEALSLTTEAVRQQLWQLQREEWVISDCGPDDGTEERARGRPAAEYCLSRSGDDLFPKLYSELAATLFDLLPDSVAALTEVTDERVRALEPIKRAPLGERVAALRSIYSPNDAYTSVEKSDRGYRIIEKNCPYLTFATERPLFCSTTVSALRRLTGCEVVRERRFQDGDGECVFHIHADRPLTPKRAAVRFEKEPEK